MPVPPMVQRPDGFRQLFVRKLRQANQRLMTSNGVAERQGERFVHRLGAVARGQLAERVEKTADASTVR